MAWLYFERGIWGELLVALGVVWLLCFAAVLTYPVSSAALRHRILVAALGWVLLVGTWMSFVLVREQSAGSWLILWLFLVVWGADVGAYFTGRAFGNRKLAVNVSPGKTWEGALGGMVLGVAAGTVTAAAVPALSSLWGLGTWIGLGVVLAAVSVLGDLFESVIKRVQGVKDSGH
jgi:phosphatidate cytidylyltransferase